MLHVMYPLAYSLMSTIALLIIIFAQVKRLAEEGHAINFGVLKILTITTGIMWVLTIGVGMYYMTGEI